MKKIRTYFAFELHSDFASETYEFAFILNAHKIVIEKDARCWAKERL
jgi:hypothetical protein